MKQQLSFLFLLLFFSCPVFAQPTHTVTDPEKKLKEARDLFNREAYALAYPILKELQQAYPDNKKTDHYYINEDVNYYYIVCELRLRLPIAEADAKQYIDETENEPRSELISYHLAHFYFAKEDFNNAIRYYNEAGLSNLSNDEIADEEFEKAYSYFNLKRFTEAAPLFNEIHQLPGNKYYLPANYYYGFISYYLGDYAAAFSAFKLVENRTEYKTIVPYYIAQILYFHGKKDEAVRYGEKALASGDLYYEKEMKLLIGQIYFEQQDFVHALPLIEYYITNTDKVRKEDFYELSYCYFQTNNLKKAIEGFSQLSSEKDTLGQNSMYLLGDCYMRLGEKENARNAFQYCAYSSNDNKQKEISLFNYAKLSYELGYHDVALNEMKKFMSDYPASVYGTEAKEILVSLLANTNNFTEALALYQSIHRPTAPEQKVYPRILYGKAMEYINDQQINEADGLLNTIVALPLSKITPYAYFWKGEIAYRLNNYDSAIFYLTEFTQSNIPAQSDVNSINAKYDLGYSWLKKENYKQALACFEPIASGSTTASSLQQDAYIRTADCYYMSKNFAKANTLYEGAINNALPQSDYALFQKAMIAGIKSTANKISLLNNLLTKYSNSNLLPDATMEIANTYMADEKFKEALPYLTGVIGTNAEGLKPGAYAKSGLCYYNLNDDSDALSNYELLLQKYPSSSEAEDALATIKRIYLEENRPDDYIALMQKAGKSVSPVEADQLTYNAAEIKFNQGDCDAATTAFSNYLMKFPAGSYTLDAHYDLAECNNKNKDWEKAVTEYDYVNKQGISKYFEKATLAAATISYFDLKHYDTAELYFQSLREGAVNQDNQLEALRGLVRCYYQLKDYTKANTAAKDLLTRKGINTDDRSIALLVLGKSQETIDSDFVAATITFKACASINRSAWGAEARYEIANCQFQLANYPAAQKAAMAVIKETGSYDYWVTSAYLLLGDIFMQQKDYFNAKATYESVAQNSIIPELKVRAQQKLDNAIAEEKANSKIN